jgi:hypothetical protein
MDNGKKNPVGRPSSNDVAVQFPMKIPKSIKNRYDLMNKQDKYNLRKEMVEIIRSYTHEEENCNSNLKSLADLKPKPIQVPHSIQIAEEPEDETTLKFRKLKTLYDKRLITQEEYEAKKANILDSL